MSHREVPRAEKLKFKVVTPISALLGKDSWELGTAWSKE
jgi:hypothetical protein